MDKKMKILFTGGGSGGHITPIIAIVREIKKIMPLDTELLYVGPREKWASLFLTQEDIRVKQILSGKIRRYFTLKAILLNTLDLFKLFLGFFQAFFIIFLENPDLVFSKGGYGSISIVFCAKIFQIPIFLHESDVYPGLANQVASKFATKIFTSFPKTQYFSAEKIIIAGNPIRKEILKGSEEQDRKKLNLTGEKPVLFVYGGSLGSQRINDLILLILPELLKEFEVIHQCGIKNFKDVKAESQMVMPDELKKYYHVFGFLKELELKEVYFVSDIILSRAGSGTIFEIAALGKPSILVPLPESAQNHQLRNAYAFAQNGASLVIEEKNFNPQFFLEKLRFLISQPEKDLEKMSMEAQKFSRPNAAKAIANYLIKYLLI